MAGASATAQRRAALKYCETKHGRRVVVQFAYNPDLVKVVQGLPKRWFDKEGANSLGIKNAWLIPDDTASVEAATIALKDAGAELDVAADIVESAMAAQDARAASRAESADIDVPTKLPLLPFQKAGILYAEMHGGRVIYGDEMGLGKTPEALGFLARNAKALPALVVCPGSVRVNWIREVSKFTSFTSRIVCSKTNLPGFKRMGIPAGTEAEAGWDLTVMNYETFRVEDARTWLKRMLADGATAEERLEARRMLAESGKQSLKAIAEAFEKAAIADVNGRAMLQALIDEIKERKTDGPKFAAYVNGVPLEKFLAAGGFKTVVVDECHFIKESDASRSRATAAICDALPHALLLTGTPVKNRPRELWHLVRCVDKSVFPSYHKYALRYCDGKQTRFGFDDKGASNLAELDAIVRERVMVRREKLDVLKELPPHRRATVVVTLDEEAYEDYEEQAAPYMDSLREAQAKREDWKARLDAMDPEERAAYMAAHAEEVARMATLRGVMVSDIAALRKIAAMAKMPVVVERIADMVDQVGKVALFGHHHEVSDRALASLSAMGLRCIRVDGRDADAARRQGAIDAFQAGDAQVAMLGINAAGIGLNLTASSNAVFLELDWTPGAIQQASARCWRLGQAMPVTTWFYVAERTVETTLAKMIDIKDEVVNAALGETDRTLNEDGIVDAIVGDLALGKKTK